MLVRQGGALGRTRVCCVTDFEGPCDNEMTYVT